MCSSKSQIERGLKQGWAAALILGMLLAFVGYLRIRHGLSIGAGLRGLVALYALGFAPGYALQRWVFRLGSARRMEFVISSLILGSLITPMVWYASCWLGVERAVWVVLVILAIVVPIDYFRNRDRQQRGERVSFFSVLIWTSAVAFAVIWSHSTSVVEHRDGQVHMLPYGDHVLHAMLVAELSRGVPPETIPFMAGAKSWAYHQMPDVWCEMVRRISGLSAVEAYFYLALPFRYLLTSLACYLGMVGRFGRGAAFASSLCLFGFVGIAGWPIFRNDLLYYFYLSYPTSFGLMGVFLIVFYLTQKPTPSRGCWLVTTLLAGLLLYYKANYALAVVPAGLMCAAVHFQRGREYGILFACLAVTGLIVTLRWWQVANADMNPQMLLKPGAFLSWWWTTESSMQSLVGESIRSTVNALHPFIKWPAILVMCLVIRFHLGLVVIAYAVFRMGFGRRPSTAPIADRFIILTLVITCAGFVLFPIQRGFEWNVSMHMFYLVSALTLALAGPVLVDISGRVLRASKPVTILAALVLLGAVADNALALRRKALWDTRVGSDVITRDLYECYRYVNQSTPPRSLIAQPHFREGRSSAGVFSGRRIVLENGEAWVDFFDTRPALADLSALYGDAAGERLRGIVERWDIDFIVGDASAGRWQWDVPFLTCVYRNGSASVYRVEREAEQSLARSRECSQFELSQLSRRR